MLGRNVDRHRRRHLNYGFHTGDRWHSGIKSVPLKRIHGVLMDPSDFHGAHPVVIPKPRGVEYITQNFRAHLTPSHRVLQNADGFYLPRLGFPANFWHYNPYAKG